ncbi:unnamed protein product [Boreogadus saida]
MFSVDRGSGEVRLTGSPRRERAPLDLGRRRPPLIYPAAAVRSTTSAGRDAAGFGVRRKRLAVCAELPDARPRTLYLLTVLANGGRGQLRGRAAHRAVAVTTRTQRARPRRSACSWRCGEEMPAGTASGRVACHDRDSGPNARLTYRFLQATWHLRSTPTVLFIWVPYSSSSCPTLLSACCTNQVPALSSISQRTTTTEARRQNASERSRSRRRAPPAAAARGAASAETRPPRDRRAPAAAAAAVRRRQRRAAAVRAGAPHAQQATEANEAADRTRRVTRRRLPRRDDSGPAFPPPLKSWQPAKSACRRSPPQLTACGAAWEIAPVEAWTRAAVQPPSCCVSVQRRAPSPQLHRHGLIHRTTTTTTPPHFSSTRRVKILAMPVMEDRPPGSLSATVHAKDPDEGENGSSPTPLRPRAERFTLDPSTGDLRSSSPLSQSERGEYSLVVTATDRGLPPRSSSCSLQIQPCVLVITCPSLLPHPTSLPHPSWDMRAEARGRTKRSQSAPDEVQLYAG